MEEVLCKLIEQSPALALVALSIWLNYKLVSHWMSKVENAMQQNVVALREITTTLKEMNGR